MSSSPRTSVRNGKNGALVRRNSAFAASSIRPRSVGLSGRNESHGFQRWSVSLAPSTRSWPSLCGTLTDRLDRSTRIAKSDLP